MPRGASAHGRPGSPSASVPVLPDDPLAPAALARPTAPTDVRAANMSLLLRTLRDHPSCSRTELVRATGLSKATVSTLVADLLARGLVSEEGTSPDGGVGRPSTALTPVGGRVAGVCVEIGPYALSAASVDLSGQVLEREAVALTAPPGQARAVVSQVGGLLASRLVSLAAHGVHVPALTVAQTGILNYQDGSVRLSSSMGWSGVPLREAVTAELGRQLDRRVGHEARVLPRVLVENDAKLAALATYRRYARRGVRNLLYVSAGDGVGAGIVCDGHLLRGWLGQSGEVGHIPVGEGDYLCRCGRRGCWETTVGLEALTRALPAGSPARDRSLPLAERIERTRAVYDADRSRLDGPVTTAVEQLCRGLVALVDVLSPQVVVLSGWLAAFSDVVTEPVRTYLASRQLDPAATVQVEASDLGVWAPAVGGALMALEPALTDPTTVPALAD